MTRRLTAALVFLLLVFACFRVLGPKIDDPSNYPAQTLSLGEGEIFINLIATAKTDFHFFVSKSYSMSPIYAYLGVEQTQGEVISIERVVLRQPQEPEQTYALEAVKSTTDGTLKELEMKKRGPSYSFTATPSFGTNIDLEINLERCSKDVCEHETHHATIEFIDKPTEFGFGLIRALMSI